MKLSVLMPAYNEEKWMPTIVERVLDQNVPGITSTELIIVDDASTDRTPEIMKELKEKYPDSIVDLYHQKNVGKGGAIQTAIEKASGDVCIIQDADLEYSPSEYPLILEPIISGRADCVYGSRFLGASPKKLLFFWHKVGNMILTTFTNMLTNLDFTDMETCYKAFRLDLLKTIPIRSKCFGFEPEITVKIAKRGFRVYEVGISYDGRTYGEGKKIGWKDGFKAMYVLMKYWLINDSRKKDQDGAAGPPEK